MTAEKLKILSSVYSNVKTTKMMVTDENYKILWSNDNFLSDNMNGKTLKDFLPEEYKNAVSENVIIPVTIANFNYTINVLPISNDEKEIEGYLIRLITIKEITDHQLNKDISESDIEFFSQIRTQVSGIISIATIIHDTLERAELYDELKYLNHQVNYCYKLLALTLNKSEVAKYSFGLHNIVKVNLKTFLNDIIFIIKTLLRGSDVEFIFNCSSDMYIDVDTDRLVVMLLNLIINGIQYNISEKKKIVLEAKKSGESITLSVSDNGQGMSNQQISEIFDKFSFSPMLEPFKQKIGYGYYIVNYFCKTFKSTVLITSTVNSGTTVSVKIPQSNSEQLPLYLESKTAEYLSNRFSNIYIALSQITNINFF